MSKGLSVSKRKKVFERDNYICQMCGVDVVYEKDNYELRKQSNFAHVDHIIPKYRGGGNGYDNIATLCTRCNLKKGKRKSHEIIENCGIDISFILNLAEYEKRYAIFEAEIFEMTLEEEIFKKYQELLSLKKLKKMVIDKCQ